MLAVAEGVEFSYRGGAAVLRCVDLELGAGQSVALSGPSGSGKSTLIALLAGLLAPSRGRLEVVGRDMSVARNRRSVRRAGVAWVQQTANVMPERSALENVGLALRARGMTWRQARPVAARSLESVGLSDVSHAPCAKLSGGQSQRVCIARALAAEPRLMLADEPTGQLDAATSGFVLEMMFRALRTREGTALVIATHDPVAVAHCDVVLEFDNGRLRRRG